jgi:DmsE family decaheme c-type cytochrome
MCHKVLKVAPWLIATIGLIASPLPLLAAEEDQDAVPQVGRTPEEAEAAVRRVEQGHFTDKGADTCIKCHGEDSEFPVFAIFRTRHAVAADKRTPFAQHQCESCHGPGAEHARRVRRGQTRPPVLNFGKDAWTPIRDQNRVCLECHHNHQRIEWKGSIHELNRIGCAQCHKAHVAHDLVLNRRTQPSVCYDCHPAQRAQFFYSSHHPVREGKMACSACHNVHGDDGSELLVKATARENCTSCHAEKRGPFLWEHAPAAEDCRLCHWPHGSNQPALLTKRPPFLCQECHSQAGHPSVEYDGDAVNRMSRFLVIKGCLNCHFQVHGSNHPSGVTLLR